MFHPAKRWHGKNDRFRSWWIKQYVTQKNTCRALSVKWRMRSERWYDLSDDKWLIWNDAMIRITDSPKNMIMWNWAFPGKNMHFPIYWRYQCWPPGFLVDFIMTTLEFPFLHWTGTWKSTFSPSNSDIPLGILIAFTLPPSHSGTFHWYPQQGVYGFFLEKPNKYLIGRKLNTRWKWRWIYFFNLFATKVLFDWISTLKFVTSIKLLLWTA